MRWLCVLLSLSLVGCGGLVEAYRQEKDYVLYDASKAPPRSGTPAGDFAKLVETERLLAEVDRTILDGLDSDGTLAKGRTSLEAAVAAQRTALGEQLPALRKQRAGELRALVSR